MTVSSFVINEASSSVILYLSWLLCSASSSPPPPPFGKCLMINPKTSYRCLSAHSCRSTDFTKMMICSLVQCLPVQVAVFSFRTQARSCNADNVVWNPHSQRRRRKNKNVKGGAAKKKKTLQTFRCKHACCPEEERTPKHPRQSFRSWS